MAVGTLGRTLMVVGFVVSTMYLSFGTYALTRDTLSGPYFLASYYSLLGGEAAFARPIEYEWHKGTYLLELKTVVNDSISLSKLNGSLVLQSGFLSPLVDDYIDLNRSSTSAAAASQLPHCPRYFHPSFYYAEKCQQVRQVPISFLSFVETFDSLGGNSLLNRPETVSLATLKVGGLPDAPRFNVTRNAVELLFMVDIVLFANETMECSQHTDCLSFLEMVAGQMPSLNLAPDTVRCVPESVSDMYNWTKHGCSVSIKPGRVEKCFGTNSTSEDGCEFVLFWQIFLEPPSAYTAMRVWRWGGVGLVFGLFLYLFFALYLARIFQQGYLTYYYFLPPIDMDLGIGLVYEYKLKLIGEQFTRHTGKFLLRASGFALPLSQSPLRITFDREDIEGEKVATFEVRGSFVPTAQMLMLRRRSESNISVNRPIHRVDPRHDSAVDGSHIRGVTVDIRWNNEFIEADAVTPNVKPTFRLAIPILIKTRWNVLFGWVSFIIGVLACYSRNQTFVQRAHLTVLFGYVTIIHLTYINLIVFTALSFVENARIKPLFWGVGTERPIMPVFFYCSFLLLLVSALGLVAFMLKRFPRSDKARERSARALTTLPNFTPTMKLSKMGARERESMRRRRVGGNQVIALKDRPLKRASAAVANHTTNSSTSVLPHSTSALSLSTSTAKVTQHRPIN